MELILTFTGMYDYGSTFDRRFLEQCRTVYSKQLGEQMKMKIVYVGIMSREAYKERTIAIAKGEYKRKKNEPKIWFESLKSMAQVLSSENRQLLKTILEYKPSSLADLEEMTGRKNPICLVH